MREAWRKITIKDTKFSVFLFFCFLVFLVWFVTYGMRALQLMAKFCKVMKVMLDIKVIKRHRKEWLIRSQSVEVAKISLHYFAKHLFKNSF